MAEAGTGYITLKPDFSGFSGSNLQKGIDPAIDSTGKHMQSRFGAVFGSIAKMAGGLFLAKGITDFITNGIAALGEIERLTAQTESVIKSTGGAAGVATADILKLADGLEKLTGTEAESVQAGANLLLTFKNVANGVGESNQIFDRATAAALDLSVAFGQDMASSSIQLGKALDNPIQGVTALQRVGVSFTASQKETIKALVESGDVMGAQKIILGELESQVGGSAQAFGNTLPGQIAKARNTFGELQEKIVVAVIPAFTAVVTFIAVSLVPAVSNVIDWVSRFGDRFPWVRDLAVPAMAAMAVAAVLHFGAMAAAAVKAGVVHAAQVVAKVAGWVLLGATAMAQAAVIAAAWLISLGPIALVVAAVIALVAVVVLNFDTIKEVIGKAWEAIKSTTQAAWGSVKGFFDEAWTRIKSAVATGVMAVVGAFLTMAEKVVGAAATAFGWVPGIGDKLNEAKTAISKFKDDVNASLSKIQDKEVKITFKSYGSADAADRSQTGDGPGRGGPALSRVQSILNGIPGTYVTSTYRSPAQNAAAGGSPTSYHMDRNNPAVDIGGSTSALNTVAAKLRAAGGWRELLWQVKGHYDHVHVANTGGYVPGGGPDRDSVMAMLTPGEFVFSRTAVKAIGAEKLAGLHTQALAGFNAGGFVPYIKTVLAETPRDQWLRNFNTQFGNLVGVFERGDDVVNGAGEVIDNMFGNTGKLIPAVMGAGDQLMRLWAVISEGDDVLSGFAEIVDNIFGNTGALAAPIFDMVKGSVLEDVNAANVAKQQNRYDTSLLNAIGPNRQWGTPQDMTLYDEQLVGSLSGGSSRQWGSAEDMAEYDRKLIAAISGAVVAGVRQTVRTG